MARGDGFEAVLRVANRLDGLGQWLGVFVVAMILSLILPTWIVAIPVGLAFDAAFRGQGPHGWANQTDLVLLCILISDLIAASPFTAYAWHCEQKIQRATMSAYSEAAKRTAPQDDACAAKAVRPSISALADQIENRHPPEVISIEVIRGG